MDRTKYLEIYASILALYYISWFTLWTVYSWEPDCWISRTGNQSEHLTRFLKICVWITRHVHTQREGNVVCRKLMCLNCVCVQGFEECRSAWWACKGVDSEHQRQESLRTTEADDRRGLELRGNQVLSALSAWLHVKSVNWSSTSASSSGLVLFSRLWFWKRFSWKQLSVDILGVTIIAP